MDEHLRAEVNLLHANLCQALADPTRILILYALADGAKHVAALAAALDTPQSTISRHLKVLRERSLVLAERDGAQLRYSLSDPRVIAALDMLRAVLIDALTRRSNLAEIR
ncbi:MAG: ArsR/SmtB family transcription factor [Thermoleophilia bacterium]